MNRCAGTSGRWILPGFAILFSVPEGVWVLPGVWLPKQQRQDEDCERRYEPPVNGDCNDHSHPGRFLIQPSSPPLRWHGPQVASDGLRTDGALFRADLPRPLPHTQKKPGQSIAALPRSRPCLSEFLRYFAKEIPIPVQISTKMGIGI